MKYWLLAWLALSIIPAQAQITWFAERITQDTVQIGRNPSFLIDSAGYLHLSFWENQTDRLIYAKKHITATEWSFQKVDSAKTGGYVSKIQLDPLGNPAIAYFENVNQQLQVRLATQNPFTHQWEIDTSLQIDWGMYGTNALNAPGYLHASIDLGYFNNQPYILFFDARYFPEVPEFYGLEMYYAYPNNGSMTYQSYGNIPMFNPSITYREWKAGAKYGEFCTIVKQKNGHWSIFTQGTGNGELYRFTSITDPTYTNRTVIDSFLRVNPDLTYPSYIQEHRLFCTFEGISACEASNEDIHLTYGYSQLYGKNNFTAWFKQNHLTLQHLRLKANGDILYHPIFPRDSIYRNYTSVQTIGSDTVLVTFNEPYRNLLRLAYSLDTGETWQVKNIQNMSFPSAYAPIAVYNDSLYVIYYHTDNKRLEMATLPLHNLNAPWNISAITQSQETGTTIASVVNKSGNDYRVHVVYNNLPARQLHYAYKSSGQWNYYTLPNNPYTTSADLQLDANGNATILYNDKLSNQTRLARKNGTSFLLETVHPSIAGEHLNLRYSPTYDTLHACLYDMNLNTLIYARKILNGTWTFEFPEMVGQSVAGEYASLCIDRYGLPHIVYYDRQNTQLKHAFKTTANPNWQTEIIAYDAAIDQGKFCKAIIGTNDVLQVAWVNSTANQIEYARKYLGLWERDTVISQTVGLVGMPLAMSTDDSSSAWIVYNVQNTLPEVRIARKSFQQSEWGSLPVGQNNFQLGNVFDFELLDTLLFITGRTHQPQQLGIGLLTGILTFNAVSTQPETPISLTLYPNPFQNQLFLQVSPPTLTPETLQIYDLHGKKHLEKPLETKMVLNLDFLPSGLYILKVGNTAHKIIKQ